MPQGKGTYGSQVGRPPKKSTPKKDWHPPMADDSRAGVRPPMADSKKVAKPKSIKESKPKKKEGEFEQIKPYPPREDQGPKFAEGGKVESNPYGWPSSDSRKR